MKPRAAGPLLLALLSTGLAMSCDKTTSAPPAEEPEVATAPPPPPNPTTRDLMEGPRTDLETMIAPLKLKVPADWKLEILGSAAMAEGPSPSGEQQIMITTLPGMDDKRIAAWIAGANASAAEHPDRLQVHQLQSINGMDALEKISFTEPMILAATTTSPDSASTQSSADDSGGVVNYTRYVFVPFEGSYIPCSFGISGMTPEEYRQDIDFIRSLLDTAQRSSRPEFQ